MPGNSIEQPKRRGRGFDKQIIIDGIKSGRNAKQIAKDLNTESVESVQHAITRIHKLMKQSREDSVVDHEDNSAEPESWTEIQDYIPVWLDVPLYADQETLDELENVTRDSEWSSQFEWYPETKGGELYIYDKTDIVELRKFMVREGFYLLLLSEDDAYSNSFNKISIMTMPTPPEISADEEKWRTEIFQVQYGNNLEKLRISLKNYVIDSGVRIDRTGTQEKVWYDPERMLDIDEKLQKDNLYFLLVYDPLASVKLGYSRVILVSKDNEIVLIDNLTNREIKELYYDMQLNPGITMTDSGTYKQNKPDEVFKRKIMYWTRKIPHEILQEASDLIEYFDETMADIYRSICGAYMKEHNMDLYDLRCGSPI